MARWFKYKIPYRAGPTFIAKYMTGNFRENLSSEQLKYQIKSNDEINFDKLIKLIVTHFLITNSEPHI